ncbi:MAG TPA: hypothetical protein VHE13_08260, partial [Opitutus sp.]|nr:hypothetical protein [Opitutus sp.]
MSSSAVAPAPAALDTDARRPALIVVAVDISPERGSEPGKAWNWCCALARQYRLHVVTGSALDPRCREHPAAAEWTWHLTPSAQPIDPGLSYYRHYARWCDEALAMAQAVIAREPVAGIHHITLGSFRVLPRYDRLGVPYTLGPLGGGEVAPPA